MKKENNLSLFSAEPKALTISEFILGLNSELKAKKTKIVGEVGEAKSGPTGHMYFTLKDADNPAMVSCIMWASKYRLFGIKLEPGMKIVASGNPEIYAPNGRLSFICDTIELAGEGELKKQYDELKKKLEKEGLFSPENKRELPKYPQKIGVITAKQGAVIHDFLNNIGKFGFNIKFIDSRVEGAEAVEDLLASIRTFRNKDLDVLVIIRGGGSMESLMAFNNEMLVREVVGFPAPVIVGIGHDQDVPLVCLAADRSESTPTAVANALGESWEKAKLFIEKQERNILVTYQEVLNDAKLLISNALANVSHAGNIIAKKYREIEHKFRISLEKMGSMIMRANEFLATAEKIIASNNPERQLKLGYSIAYLKGKILRETAQAEKGDELEIKLSDGTIKSTVK